MVNEPRVRVGIVGGLEGLRLVQLEDIYRLATGREDDMEQITDKYVKTFAKPALDRIRQGRDGGGGGEGGGRRGKGGDPLAELKRVSSLADDKEMQTRISVVQRIGDGLPTLLERLRAADVGDKLGTAHFLLSTAHKAKGLEFPTVLLWDDFADVHRVKNVGGDGSTFSITVMDHVAGETYQDSVVQTEDSPLIPLDPNSQSLIPKCT